MDFNALRAQTLGSGTDEEAVTVNTRALIDKVLARYSGEWTVLRELLQNAADAAATKITIKFETIPSSTIPLPQNASSSSLLKHTVQHHTLKRLVVTNNGQPFNENDWARLKRIAEGNPDETKIGAFGVGFYSTFADCEEPFVSSGNQAMAFFWKNNSLFTRRLKLPEAESDADTNFVLDYRDTTSPIPPLLPLAQFLANSLTFVGIENIEFWLDQYNILSLTKKTSPSQDVPLPRDIEPKTSEGFMKVTTVTKEVAQIDGQWMAILGWKQPRKAGNRQPDRDTAPSLRKFFSRLAGTSGLEEAQSTENLNVKPENDGLATRASATIFLNVNTATIKTFTGAKFNEELERATKKPPPKYTKLAVLTAPYVENSGLSEASVAGDVFATVLPTKNGKIFIGFPTHQTTGLSAHISAPSVIPTVERESIDLNARYVRTWNMEMLRVAGIVCRIAWSSEMMALKDKILRSLSGRSKIRPDDVEPVLPEAVTTSQNFTFRESTPAAKTGQLIEDAFWTCSKKASIDVISTCGVLPTHEVRMAPKDLSFMEGIPILPDRLVAEAKPFVDRLTEFGLVTEVTVSDIKRALESSSLSATQVTEFLNWLTKQSSQGKLDRTAVSNLLSVAVANDEAPDGSPSQVLVLGQMQHFLNASKIPTDVPIPSTVMPFKFTRTFSKHDLETLGWEELQMVPWIRWLIDEAGNRHTLPASQDLTQAPAFAQQILPILSKQWDSLSQSSKISLVQLLSAETVMPTKFGMKRPVDAYFPNVKLFDDLPTITGLGNAKDKFLTQLGVRKTVELGMVFDRLLAMEGGSKKPDTGNRPQSSHVDLIHYLASVRDDIPGQDIAKLRATPICPKVDKSNEKGQSNKRYKVSELFEPRPELRELGLPVLAWPGIYRSSSPEGKFLSSLGLRTQPAAAELIDIMAKAGAQNDISLRDKTLAYFLSHHHAHQYNNFDYSKVTTPFLPLENKPDRLSIPSECYVDEGAALFGFDILRKDLQSHSSRFGVRMNPAMDSCINILTRRPPATYLDARTIFEYLARRLGEITVTHVPRLAETNFVPIFPKDKGKASAKAFTSPRNCFLGESEAFGEIFTYVDFGAEANTFLLRCGSKVEPTMTEIAQILVREPARISSTFRSSEKYLNLLRSLAANVSMLKKNKELWKEMKKSPFLLASKQLALTQAQEEAAAAHSDGFDDLDEEESQGIREFQLATAQDTIIVDDYIAYNLFKHSILCAPQEEILEEFYYTLGSQPLSALVEEAARHGPRAADQRPAQKLQKQIIERSQLFLHDQAADAIKHDSRWLEKNLQVQLVPSITLRRSLKGRDVTHTQKRSAVVTQVNKEFTLWITGEKPDLYQVSQALVHLLLTRPRPHSALTLEMMLKTDLLDLRARGFNVARILRQKAAEARIAENRRQQELEEERKRIEEQEKVWNASQEQVARDKAHRKQLPGGFPDSPDSKALVSTQANKAPSDGDGDLRQQSRSLFSNISRQLGLGGNRPLQPMLGNQPYDPPTPRPQSAVADGGHDPPPPYSQQGQQSAADQPVTAPHQLHNNLLSAIKKSRPHNSSNIFSRGENNVVSETKSYCDERPAHDLTFVAEMPHGIQMFLSPSSTPNSSAFLSEHSAGLRTFAGLVKSVGDVFSLNPHTLNIFYETGGKTIAFNRNGSIFCNYLYFQQLHEGNMRGLKAGEVDPDAFVYWWVILCHELAHNLVADHSSNHSYYTEGFVSQYFGRVVRLLGERSRASAAPTNEATLPIR